MRLVFALNVFAIADLLQRVLLLFLLATSSLLVVLLLYLALLRVARELFARWRQRAVARYRGAVDALLRPTPPAGALAQLRRCPRRHRRIVGDLLLAPLRVATGDLVVHLRAAAAALGLIDLWCADLEDRRWWVRAAAARALGLLRSTPAFTSLVAALDDSHADVRAAAVDALGALGDPRAVPELISRLTDQSRHQRVRLIEALRGFGEPVTPALIAHARQHRGSVAMVIDVLGLIGGAAAADDLIAWCSDERTEVRTAALRGLGSIGLTDRSFYYALRALGDDAPDVRAMAARALGRSGRQDAADDLDGHLMDQWDVAAQCAAALGMLGNAGLARLQARTGDAGQAGDLARQMVWERRTATTEPPAAPA